MPEPDDTPQDAPEPEFEISEARRVLMRALDSIEENETDAAEMGHEVEEQYLLVIGATTVRKPDGERYTIRHWDSTVHPHFIFTGLLGEVAIRLAQNSKLLDITRDGDDDDGDDDEE